MLAGVLLSSANIYADERTQALIDTRQGLLKVMGFYIGPMVAMARQQMPYDADMVKANATKMAELAAMIPDVFRVDTSASDQILSRASVSMSDAEVSTRNTSGIMAASSAILVALALTMSAS